MRRFRVRSSVCLWILTGAFLFFGQPGRAQASESAEGLPNFARVTDGLYRGGQPSSAGFIALQHMGVGIVVNFRNEPKEISAEKLQVESLGMKYVGIPWSGRDEPSDSQIMEFLDLVRANPQTKVFAHCQRGADRTGTMIAAYRIVIQHESVQEAVSEMHNFHYDHFWLPQLQRYVVSLPSLV